MDGTMGSAEEDIAWLKSTFHPIPKPALPDDCIEYSLYIIDSSIDSSIERNNPSETRVQLKDVLKRAGELQRQWLQDYIWQRQSFTLELVKDNDVSCLRGRTEYGDSIEDEWVIVWLLRELTQKFSNLWVKVTDSDGEFLLIEASGSLPAWLEPEVAENRVWISNGQLKIIKSLGNAKSKRTDEKLTILEARQIILSQPKRIMHSSSMQEEAFYRLRNYPGQIKDNVHYAIVTLPRKVAYLLLQKAAYVAPAIEAFYLRDPISLKPLQAKDASLKLTFPPQDLVELSVVFPRVAYAQLRSQDLPLLDVWKGTMPPPCEAAARAQAETGMKLTCGFEMLLSDAQYQDRPQTREMTLLLEDIDSGDATLPTNAELLTLKKRADDEEWLDINFDDLQQELDRGKGPKPDEKGKQPEFGDKAAQENLQRIVKQFESFLHDNKTGDEVSGLFGEDDSDTDELDDVDSDDLEADNDGEFGASDLNKLMQEMMGMPTEVMEEVMSGKIDALSNGTVPRAPNLSESTSKAAKQVDELSSDEEIDEDVEIGELMKRMGVELKASGSLDLTSDEPEHSHAVEDEIKDDVVDEVDTSDVDEDDPEYQRKEEIAKSLLDSFRAQGGADGPASNLMALMAEQYAADGRQKEGKDIAKRQKLLLDLAETPD